MRRDIMSKTETCKRYLMFLVGVLVCATGISFITRAGLGTSPISSDEMKIDTTLGVGTTVTMRFNL